MKRNLILSIAAAAALATPASAFDVYQQVEALNDPIQFANGNPITAGAFSVRVGFFDYDTVNFANNNAQIQANAGNSANLLSNFETLYVIDGTEGDAGASGVGNPNADFTGPGLLYSYVFTTDADWTTNFSLYSSKHIYAWFQADSNPSEQLIVADSAAFFAGGTDPITDAAGVLQIISGSGTLVTVVGTNTGSSLQMVPEPTSMLLLFGGLGALAFRRRRA